MSIQVIVELPVKPDRLDQVHPLFASLLPQTRSREGNEGVTVHRDQDHPASIILIEKRASGGQYEAYNRWRAEQGDLENLANLLKSPPKCRFMEQLTLYSAVAFPANLPVLTRPASYPTWQDADIYDPQITFCGTVGEIL